MRFGQGKSALVTGAGSGIGRALALALAREGHDVLLVGRDKGRLERVMREAGACARFLVADLATQEGIDHVAASGPDQLDVLVHSAGYYVRTPVASTSLAEWGKVDGVNLHAPMLLTAAFLPKLITTQGQVVFINSSAGLSSGTHGLAAYSASKHALKAAADCLRQEVNAAGVRVLCIFPGRTDTPMQSRILAEEGRTPDSDTLIDANDIAAMALAALKISRSAEVTDIVIRPLQSMKRTASCV